MKRYDYFVDENSGMACVVDTTYSFADAGEMLAYAGENGWEMSEIAPPAYAYDNNGALRDDLLTW